MHRNHSHQPSQTHGDRIPRRSRKGVAGVTLLPDEERETKSERWTKKLDKTKSKSENSRHNTGEQKAERQRCGDDRYREAKGESWGN